MAHGAAVPEVHKSAFQTADSKDIIIPRDKRGVFDEKVLLGKGAQGRVRFSNQRSVIRKANLSTA